MARVKPLEVADVVELLVLLQKFGTYITNLPLAIFR